MGVSMWAASRLARLPTRRGFLIFFLSSSSSSLHEAANSRLRDIDDLRLVLYFLPTLSLSCDDEMCGLCILSLRCDARSRIFFREPSSAMPRENADVIAVGFFFCFERLGNRTRACAMRRKACKRVAINFERCKHFSEDDLWRQSLKNISLQSSKWFRSETLGNGRVSGADSLVDKLCKQ